MNTEELIRTLNGLRFPLQDEKKCQAAIEEALNKIGVEYNREFRLDDKNIPDFYIPGLLLAIEVKIKGRPLDIYKQCIRYCEFELVKAILVMTSKSMGLKQEINGKPCYSINMGKAWL